MSECAVCLDKFSLVEDISVVSCGHCFHRACIEKWGKTPSGTTCRARAYPPCPECRAPFSLAAQPRGCIVPKLHLSGLTLVKTDEFSAWKKSADDAADHQARAGNAEKELREEKTKTDLLRANLIDFAEKLNAKKEECKAQEKSLQDLNAACMKFEAASEKEATLLKKECLDKEKEISAAHERIKGMEENHRQHREIAENMTKLYDQEAQLRSATEEQLVDCQARLREAEKYAQERNDDIDFLEGTLFEEFEKSKSELVDRADLLTNQVSAMRIQEERYASETRRREDLIRELRDRLVESQRHCKEENGNLIGMAGLVRSFFASSETISTHNSYDLDEAQIASFYDTADDNDNDSIEIIDEEPADCEVEESVCQAEEEEELTGDHSAKAGNVERSVNYIAPVCVSPVSSMVTCGNGRKATSRKRDADFVSTMERMLDQGLKAASAPSEAEFSKTIKVVKECTDPASSASAFDSVSAFLSSTFPSPHYDHYVRTVIEELTPLLRLCFADVPAFDGGIGDGRVDLVCSALRLVAFLLLSRPGIAQSLVGEIGMIPILTRLLRFDVQRIKLLALTLLDIVANRPAFDFKVPAFSVSHLSSLFRDSSLVQSAVTTLIHGISKGKRFFRWQPVLDQLWKDSRLRDVTKQFLLDLLRVDGSLQA